MRATKRAYAIDGDGEPSFSCLLSPSPCHVKLVRVFGGSDQWSVTLAAVQREWVPADFVLLPSEVMDALGILPGEYLAVEIDSDSEITVPTTDCVVGLHFLAFKAIKHWDSCAGIEDIECSSHWTTQWPQRASERALTQSSSMLLCGSTLREGDITIVRYLDSWIIFRIKNTAGFSLLRANESCFFDLDFHAEKHNIIKHGTRDVMAVAIQFDFFRPIHSLLDRSVANIDCSLRNQGAVAHSFLISAPSGAGKSFLLESLATECAESLVIAKGSCQRIDWLRMKKRESLVSAMGSNTFLQSAAVVFSALSHEFLDDCSNEQEIEAALGRSSALLLLDDVDALFKLFHDPNEVSSFVDGWDSHTEELQTFAYYLRVMLQYLTHENNRFSLWIVGCSRTSSTELPRSSIGSPEFERVVCLSKPSLHDRALIFSEKLQGSGLRLETLDVRDECESDTCFRWSHQLAEITRGYLPADLAAVVNKAFIMTVGSESLRSSCNKQESNIRLTLRWRTMLDALATVPLKTLQTVDFISSSSVHDADRECNWQDFAGYESSLNEIKRMLRPLCATEASKQRFSDNSLLRLSAPRGMVLHGPSGCGKTYLAKLIAKELKMNYLRVASSDLLSKYFGQTEEKIRKLFQVARSTSPSLLFFDDFDSLAHKRSSSDETSASHGSLQNRVLSTFLNELDGVTATGGQPINGKEETHVSSTVFVLVACKDLANLDEALVRPGRLHLHICLDYATEKDVEQLLIHFTKRMPLSDDIDSETIQAFLCHNDISQPTGALVESFCSQVRFEALRDAISRHTTKEEVVICQRHFYSVLRRMFFSDGDERDQ